MTINYKTNNVNENMSTDAGFHIDDKIIVNAIEYANAVIETIPTVVFQAIDFKAKSGMIGALFCKGIENNSSGIVNPIEKGYPDLLPSIAKNATRDELMNYQIGLEVKCTAGNLKSKLILGNGEKRVQDLSGITWQAHHQEVNKVIALVWDFYENKKFEMKPIITGVFYSNELTEQDWGKISGTNGRNTKVSGIKVSGKTKLGKGWIAILDKPEYLTKYKHILKIK